jgi:hypothetical protein
VSLSPGRRERAGRQRAPAHSHRRCPLWTSCGQAVDKPAEERSQPGSHFQPSPQPSGSGHSFPKSPSSSPQLSLSTRPPVPPHTLADTPTCTRACMLRCVLVVQEHAHPRARVHTYTPVHTQTRRDTCTCARADAHKAAVLPFTSISGCAWRAALFILTP